MKNWDENLVWYNFMFMKNRFIMEKIVRMNGYVYLVHDWDKKGFETYYNLGKDPDDPMWKEENEKPKQNKGKKEKEQV
jgi:hypothetical protein